MDLFRALKSSGLGGGTKKIYSDVREMRFGKRMKNISWKRWKLENVLEILKIEHQFNQISLTSAITSYWYLAILSNFKSGAEIIGFLLFGKYLADVSRVKNCDAP